MNTSAHTRSTKPPLTIIVIALLIISFLGAGFNFFVEYKNYHEFVTQRQEQVSQGETITERLCTTLAKLHSDSPPPGNVKNNPSRAYLQEQHEQLGELFRDINC